MTAIVSAGPSHGSLSLSPNGSFVYDPTPGYNGPDSFTYLASDGDRTSMATVDLNVGGPPIVVFNPTDDTNVRDSRPNNSYGGSSTMRIKTSSTTYHGYLKFEVTDFSSVKSATLRLYVADSSPHGGNIYAVSNNYDGSSSPWTEDGVTWSNAPVITGSPLADAGSVSSGSWIELDVTSAVTGSGVFSFGIRSTSSNSVRYSTKEGSNPPELVVERGSGGSGGGGEPGNTPPVAVDDSGVTDEDVALNVSAPFRTTTIKTAIH